LSEKGAIKMPSFTIVLASKQKVYNLYQEIMNQYQPDTPGVPVSSQWPLVHIQADPDNVLADGTPAYILTSTDAQLSGLRHGRVLGPGDTLALNFGSGRFVSTSAIYLLCQDKDGTQISVDLLSAVGPN
jgi:hypothetical protein